MAKKRTIEQDKSMAQWSPTKRIILGALGALLTVGGLLMVMNGLDDGPDDGRDDTRGGGREDGGGRRTTDPQCQPGHFQCGSRCCLNDWECCPDGSCSPKGWC